MEGNIGERGNRVERIIYLDNAATTRYGEEAAALIMRLLREEYGNPSSLYGMGLAAEKEVRRAAERLASALRCREDEIVFTSGATEANNLALIGGARARQKRLTGIVASPPEHASVLGAAGWLGENGFAWRQTEGTAPQDYAALVDEKTTLVSCMLVNNETGAVSDVAAIAEAVRQKNPQTLVHCDAVQGFGKLPIDLRRLPVDLLSVSAHKIYGPKGVGALFVRRGVRLTPLLYGGGQQKGLRPGTESVPLIAGFGLAAEIAAARREERFTYAAALRARLCEAVQGWGTVNSPENGSPFILNVSFEGLRSETLLHFLEAKGICVSSGSACSKGKGSHVLSAMGLSPSRVDSALRLSFSHEVTPEDIDTAAAALREGVDTLARARRSAHPAG